MFICRIRTRNLKKRVSARLRLRPRGHWDHITKHRYIMAVICIIYNKYIWITNRNVLDCQQISYIYIYSLFIGNPARYIYIYVCVWGRDFPPVQTGPGAHPASCKLGTGSFPGVKCGRGVLLTTHPLLVPQSWKSRAIPLPTLWATPGL